MFTTGSKFFTGATVASVVALIIVGNTTGSQVGWTAVLGLFSAVIVFGFLAGINFFIKDGNVKSMDTASHATSGAAQPPAPSSMWPAVGALGAALIALGSHSYPVVFKAGIVVVGAALVEWMVQAWSERASDDAAYNASLRGRIMHPLEFPLLAVLGLGVAIYSFSRIMLAINKTGGRAAFLGIGAVVLIIGFIVSYVPSLKKQLVAGVCALGALGLVAAGTVAAVSGQKKIEKYPTTFDEEFAFVCDEPGEVNGEDELSELAREIDEKAAQKVSNSANLHARVVVDEDGIIKAFQGGRAVDTLTFAMGNPVNLLFQNHAEEEHRMTLRLGTFATGEELDDGTVVKESHVACTPLMEEDGETTLSVRFEKSSRFENFDEGGYRIEVPGLDQSIPVVVP
jgi:hypothetical protein